MAKWVHCLCFCRLAGRCCNHGLDWSCKNYAVERFRIISVVLFRGRLITLTNSDERLALSWPSGESPFIQISWGNNQILRALAIHVDTGSCEEASLGFDGECCDNIYVGHDDTDALSDARSSQRSGDPQPDSTVSGLALGTQKAHGDGLRQKSWTDED